MRIAVWHNLPSGGGKRALYEHVRGLVERGHTVESWCPSTANQHSLPLSDLIKEHIIPVNLDAQAPPNLGRFLPRYWDPIQQLYEMDVHCQRCAEEINNGRFDILFSNCCMFLRPSAIGKYVKLPSVIYLQEPYRWLYEALPELPWVPPSILEQHLSQSAYLCAMTRYLVRLRGYMVQAYAERQNAKAFGRILVNSYYSRESVLRAYGLDSVVCYLGVDTDRLSDWGRVREPFLVGIGAIVAEKNIDLAIRAIGCLPEPRPMLHWIGNISNPPYLATLHQLAHEQRVAFVPHIGISDAQIVRILNRTTAMIYTPRLEPFGYAPLEANACGVPVIAIAEGGIRETIQHGVNGFLAVPNPPELAGAIESVMRNPQYARQIGMQGRQLAVERWSMAAATDRIEQQLIEVAQHYG